MYGRQAISLLVLTAITYVVAAPQFLSGFGGNQEPCVDVCASLEAHMFAENQKLVTAHSELKGCGGAGTPGCEPALERYNTQEAAYRNAEFAFIENPAVPAGRRCEKAHNMLSSRVIQKNPAEFDRAAAVVDTACV